MKTITSSITKTESILRLYIEPVYVVSAFETAFPGYTFSGWAADGTVYTSASEMPADDLALTAQWTPMDIKITFISEVNGEETGRYTPETTYKYGDVVTLSVDPADYGFTREGYFIPGWNYGFTNVAGSTITVEVVLLNSFYDAGYYDFNLTDGSVTESYSVPAGEVHLYAIWAKTSEKHTITFNGNSGMGTMPAQEVDGSGYYYTALAYNKFTREGYSFIGWTTKQEFAPATEWIEHTCGDMSVWNSDMTLYAQWEKIETADE